ncbi:MAG: hypothetical protein V1790_08710 [Planctomycetota bacterium]
MSKTYRPWNPDQDWLLPPSPREWLPEGDLVYFMLDVVRTLDLSEITGRYEQEDRGFPPYHPRLMVTLLLCSYCMGVYSSRRIQKLCDAARGFSRGHPQDDDITALILKLESGGPVLPASLHESSRGSPYPL